MEDEKEEINVNSETIAFQVAGILNKKKQRIIDYELVYQTVKSMVENEDIIDDVYRATINLLEDKYGILFDVDRQVNI